MLNYRPVEIYKVAFKDAVGRDKEKALAGYSKIKELIANNHELNQAGVKGVFKFAGMTPALDVDKGGANAATIEYHLHFKDVSYSWKPPLPVTHGLVLYAESMLRKRNFI